MTVLITLRFHLDLAAYMILSLYLIVMALRFIPNNLSASDPILIVLFPLSSNMIWTALFYFVFEMELVRLKVESESHIVYGRRYRRWRWERAGCLGSFVVIYVIQAVVIYYIIVKNVEYARENRTVIFTITIVGRIFKLLLEIWVFTKFITIFIYFI